MKPTWLIPGMFYLAALALYALLCLVQGYHPELSRHERMHATLATTD